MFKFSNICTGLCRATIPFNILFPTSGDSLYAELQQKRMILDSMHEDGWKPNDRQAVNMDARAEKNNRSNPQTYSGSKNCSNVCSFVNDCIGIEC